MATLLSWRASRANNMDVHQSIDQWIGKSENSSERLAAFPANAMAATLNRNGQAYKDGDPLPHL